MDPQRYESDAFGRPRRDRGGSAGFWYFVPATIPRGLALDELTVLALSDAENALGHLHGLGKLIQEPDLLLGPYLTREATASSRIEGTQASLSDVLRAEAGAPSEHGSDVVEVQRYLAAARRGFELIGTLPVSERLIKEVHAILMQGVRGKERQPGEIRRSPVWVGGQNDRPETALYVPPLPRHLPELLTDWERFVNEPSRMPVLVRCALMHYQFETIHPFLDGNGRIGRLLVVLMLMAERRLDLPILYLSGYLEANRREYYDRLQAVREQGQVQEWIQFFCTAVRHQSEDGVARASRLVEIREEYLKVARTTRSRLSALIELIFQNPFVTVRRVQELTGLSDPAARALIRDGQSRAWLTDIGTVGRGGRNYWVARRVFDVIEGPTTYQIEPETDDGTGDLTQAIEAEIDT